MIALDSPRWGELRDAYGPADDIPGVLRELETDEEAISQLYDAFALIERGAVTDAAYAVLPHLWRLAESRGPVDCYSLVEFVCPGETCGVEISLEPRDAQLVAVVDDLETDVERVPPPAYVPGAPWTDADALPRLADAFAATGCSDLAQQIARMGGNVLCPKCGEVLSVRHELLDPSEP